MRRKMSRALVTARERVEHWRKGHGGSGSRVPKELWEQAVSVARVEGVSAASRALRLDYGRLKDRVALAEGQGEGKAFVELEVGQLSGGSRTVVELVRQDGARMRVETAGEIDLEGLSRTFWGWQS